MLDPNKKLFRWGPISACPLFMYYTIEPAFKPLKKILKYSYPESVIIFLDSKVTWIMDSKEFSDASKDFVKTNIFNKNKRKYYFKVWGKRTVFLKKVFTNLDKISLNTLETKELNDLFKYFSDCYSSWWGITISVELISSTIEPMLGSNLKAYYKNEQEREYNSDFAILTSPTVLTFYRKEEKDLLTILTMKKNDREKEIESHQKKYYWIYNSYLKGKILDFKYFRKELYKYSKVDWKQILSGIDGYASDIRLQKSNVIRRLNLNKNLQDLIFLAEKFAILQDERKALNFRADHYLQLFVDEFARRSKLNEIDLKYVLPNEFGNLSTKEVKDLVHGRKKCFVFKCDQSQIVHLTGSEAFALYHKFGKTKEYKESMIHGRVASTGIGYHFRGIAKIVLNVKEINKVNKGDVLVATMTSPDFIMGMKKAAAVITDVGGVLSHAAIVCRELKKPCIVGTEIATKVIHDGDVIEIHSGRGTVRIVKHK